MIRLRAGQLPYVSLTADIFYRVLASEIAAQRGMYGTAATTMVGLARDTGDPAWRAALEFQLAGGNLPGALDAAGVGAPVAHDPRPVPPSWRWRRPTARPVACRRRCATESTPRATSPPPSARPWPSSAA